MTRTHTHTRTHARARAHTHTRLSLIKEQVRSRAQLHEKAVTIGNNFAQTPCSG